MVEFKGLTTPSREMQFVEINWGRWNDLYLCCLTETSTYLLTQQYYKVPSLSSTDNMIFPALLEFVF